MFIDLAQPRVRSSTRLLRIAVSIEDIIFKLEEILFFIV
jgi:hypothetical protein